MKNTIIVLFLLIFSKIIFSQFNPISVFYNDWCNTRDDFGRYITLDANGNVYVTGKAPCFDENSTNNGLDFITISYNHQLQPDNILWSNYYNGSASLDDSAIAMIIDNNGLPNGFLYVTGTSQENGGGTDITTIQYDLTTGNQNWIQKYHNGSNNYAVSVAIDADGYVYVAGNISTGGTYRIGLRKYDYQNGGQQIWFHTYPISQFKDWVSKMVIDKQGNIYTTGQSVATQDKDGNTITSYMFILKVNSDGTQQWYQTFKNSTAGLDRGNDIVVEDGTISPYSWNVYITGSTSNNVQQSQMTTIKYSTDGTQQWFNNYGDDPNYIGYSSKAISLGYIFCGNCPNVGHWDVFVTGTGQFSTSVEDIITLKYSQSGVQQWDMKYNYGNNTINLPKSIASDVYGNVFVAGLGNNSQYVILKYSLEGVLQWWYTWGAGGHMNTAYSMVLDPAGEPYVTGEYYGSNNNYDYGTTALLNPFEPDPSGTTSNLNSISSINQDTAYAVGDAGTILKTTDGGNSWVSQQSNTTVNLNSIHFINSLKGIAIGNNGTVLITTNGGLNWVNRNINLQNNLYNVHIINSNRIFILGDNGKIIRTTDGGNTWNIQQTGLNSSLLNVHFTDNNNGIIVGTIGKVLKTTNGGNSWSLINSFTNQNLRGVCMINSTNILAAGDNGSVFYSSNAGSSWVNKSYNTNKKINSINYINPYMIYLAGDSGLILWTGNKGNSLSVLNSNSIQNLKSISLYNHDCGFAVGNNGTILIRSSKYNGNGNYPNHLTWINKNGTDLPDKFQLYQNYPNPFNPSTIIKYDIPKTEYVILKIYNTLGQEIATLVNENKQPGIYDVEFNCKNLSSGVYFYRIEAGDFISVKKMLLVK